MAGNHSLRPPFFEGKNEDAEKWLDAFERYCDFVEWTDKKKYAAIRTMIQGEAAEWLSETRGLVEEMEEDERYGRLKELFLDKFRTSDTERFQRRMELGRLRQELNETVEEYRRRFENLCRKSSIGEDGQRMQYFIQGLLPLLQAHVIRNMPKSYQEAINLAMAEEGARGVSGLSRKDELEEIVDKVFTKVLALNRQKNEQANLCSLKTSHSPVVSTARGPAMNAGQPYLTGQVPPPGPARNAAQPYVVGQVPPYGPAMTSFQPHSPVTNPGPPRGPSGYAPGQPYTYEQGPPSKFREYGNGPHRGRQGPCYRCGIYGHYQRECNMGNMR